MDFFLVHQLEIEVNGKKIRKYVSCLAVDEDGHVHKDDCPLCKAGYRTQEKLFLQLYDETDGKLKVWERGKNFVGKIVSFLNRAALDPSVLAIKMTLYRAGKNSPIVEALLRAMEHGKQVAVVVEHVKVVEFDALGVGAVVF